jgi:hypothetical protein
MNELLEKQPAAQDWTPSWKPQEATRISAALNLSEAATPDDRISAANVLLQARLPGQPFDPTGASLFSGKTPDPAQFYDSARKLFEIGPESIMTPELKEWIAVQDDEEKALAIARKKRGTFANLAEKFGDAVAGPFRPLSDAELSMADDEVKAANAIIKGRRDYEMGATAAYSGRKTPTEEQPAIAPGSPEFDAAAKKVEEHRQNLLDRSAIAEYQSQLFADNVWYQYQLVRGKLDPDTDAIVKDAFTHKTMTPSMADKFRNLKDGDQQRLASSLIYGAKLQGDRQLLWDAGREFANTLVDVPKDAAESLFVDSVKRLVMDDATYQKQAETAALLEQIEAPRMAKYGYWGQSAIGLAGTLPYMGYAMVPYVGTPMIAAKAAKDFEERVAAEGGDVTSMEFQAAKWSSAVAYAAVEKMQALRIGGPITDLQKRQAFLFFWRKANSGIVARTVAGNTVMETWEEGVQKGIEDGFVAWGLGEDVARSAATGLVTEIKDTAGTMFLTSLTGVGAQTVRGRVTRNHTLNEIVAGSLHASALIDAHKANDAEAVAKHRAALSSLSRQVRDAGSPDNAIDQLVRQGVDPVHATMLTMYLQQEAVAIQRDAGLTQAEKDELLGRDRQAVDVMRDLMPDAKIEQNVDADGKFDGSFTINRTVAGVKTSTRVTTVDNVEYDLSTKTAKTSALTRLNEYGANVTPEAWDGMSDEEKRGKMTEFGLIKAANFKFDAPSGASVTDGQMKVLTGEIKFSRGMHAATLFHEYFHAMTEYLTQTEALQPADIAKLREEFGPPAEGVDEQFNEEVAADRFRDYAAKRVHFTQSSALEKIWDATVDLLAKAKAMAVKNRQPGTIEDAIFQQVVSGEYTGIPVATVRKSKEQAQEPAAPEAQQAQDAPDAKTPPTTAQTEKPPLNANVGPDLKPGGANFDSIKAKDQQKVEAKEARYDLKPGEWRATTPRGNMVFGGTDGFVDASHLMSSENPAYPAKRQPRDRNNIGARIQHEEIYQTMQAERLFESQETDGGSVITEIETAVDPEDGLKKEIIDSGNGRMNAIKIAIKEGTFEEKYGAYARMRAKRMGIDVSGMKYPIYRRRIEWVQKADQRIQPTEADMDSFVELSNVPKILKRNESEMAEADAKMLVAKGLLKLFQPGVAGNIMALSNAPFMVAFVRAAGADDLVNSDGHPTDLAERRVKRALLALLLGEGKNSREIIRALTENAQEMGMGTVVDGVLKSIGDIVGISQAKPTLSIVDATGMALRDYLEMKIAGYTSAQDWVNQGDFFNPRPEAVKSLVLAFAARANTSVGIAAIFRDYAAKARLVDVSTESLGMAEADTMQSILDRAIADTAKESEADATAQDAIPPPAIEKARQMSGTLAKTSLDQMKQAVASGATPEPINYNPQAGKDKYDENGQKVMVDEEKYLNETPELPSSQPQEFRTADGKPYANSVSAWLVYMLSGNKSEIVAKHMDFLLALVEGSTAVYDMFGGAATYTLLLSHMKALPKGSRLNEWAQSRYVTLKQIQQNPAEVSAALDALNNRFEAAIKPDDRTGDDIAATKQAILEWFNAELRGEHGVLYVPEQATLEDGRFALIDSPATAAMYLFAQNSSTQNRALDPVMHEGKPTWGLNAKPIGKDLLSIVQPDGKWKYSTRLIDHRKVVAGTAELLKDVSITNNDGWEAALEAPSGSVIFIDSSYFDAMNYDPTTQEDGDPEVWIKKVERLAQRKDVTYVITNNWNDYYVSRLEQLGFVVARSTRAKEERELIALSGRALSIVAKPVRTVDPNGYLLDAGIQPGGNQPAQDGSVEPPAASPEGQDGGQARRPGQQPDQVRPDSDSGLGKQPRYSFTSSAQEVAIFKQYKDALSIAGQTVADLNRLPTTLRQYVAKMGTDVDALVSLSGFAGWKRGPLVAPESKWPYRPAVRLSDGSIAWHPKARMHSEALSMWLKQEGRNISTFDLDQYHGDGGIGPDGRYYEKSYIGDGPGDFEETRQNAKTGKSRYSFDKPVAPIYPNLYEDVLAVSTQSDKLEDKKAWLTLDGKWINVNEHRDSVPFDDGKYQDVGVQDMAESGLVRVHWVSYTKQPGGVMYAEHAPGRLTRAQRKELEDGAIERGGTVEYDPGQAWIRQARFSFDRPWTPKTGGRLYHGTSAEQFAEFDRELIYLAEDPNESEPFALNLGLTPVGKKPRIVAVDAAPGKTKRVDDEVLLTIMEEADDIAQGDLNKRIEFEAAKARSSGFRYLAFEHPGTNGEFDAIVSLYPKEDLKIAQERGLDGIQRDGQGDIARFSFEKVGPTLSANNAAIASLAVQKLAGKEIGTEQAARAMYLFKPQGATAEQLLADANRMADSAVGQAAKKALEGKDPTRAMSIIGASAETDALVAARAGAIEGGKTALRMGKLAARGENAAMKQLLIAANGENLQQFEIDTGISWTETLLSFLPEKWKEWEDDAKKDEKPEGPQQAEAQPLPPTAEELADREKRMGQLIEAAMAWDADRRAKLEKAQADKKAEEGEGAGGETEEVGDPEAAIPAIPKELLEAHGVDLTSPEAIAHAIRLWIGDWIVRNSAGRLTPATVWMDPEAVETYRKTIRQQLEDMASKLLDPSDSGPVFVARMIGDLPTTGRPDTFERRSAMIIGSIQAHAIRQSRRELVVGIRKTIDSLAKQGKKFDPMEEDLKRKVSAEPEALARYIKRIIGWGADKSHAELEKLQASLESRRALYEKEHGYLDAEFDAEIRRDEIRLNMLTRWGNLKSMLPAEIKAAGEEITQWLSSEQDRLQREWFAQAEANGNMMTAILEGVVPIDTAKARQEPGAAQQFIEAHTYMVRQRLEALLRHGDPAKRAAAMQAIEEVMFQMSRGTEVYEATRIKYRQQWDQSVLDATKDRNGKVDRNAAAAWMKHLDEAIPAEVSTAISRQGFNGTMTYGQAIQLYVGLTQRFYASNVLFHKRTDHAKRIEAILTPADLKMVYRMRDIYEQRRAELSAVVRKVTGLDVWRPDPLYMPVQMYLGSRGGLGTAGNVRAWKSLSDALTPRVRNNRDFDESVDVQSMFFQRMEDTARAIGYGTRGLTIRGVLGKKSLHDAIERYYGKQPVRELMKHITQAMAGVDRQGEGKVESVLAMVRKANTYMALSFNLLSMAKQVGSFPAFMFKLGAGDFITAITQYDAQSWTELKDSDGYKARYMGGIAPEVMEILDDPSQGKIKRAYKAGMVTVQAGDYIAAKMVATGIYKAKVAALINAGMGVQQAKERAKTEAWAIVEETQQSGRTENVAGVYRNYGEMAKLVFQFASAPLMQLSHEYHAAMDAKAGVAGAKERLFRAILLNHVIIPGIMSAIAWAFNSLLLGDEPPEDRDSILEVVANNLMFEPLSRILVVGSVMEALGNSVLNGKLPGFANDIPASRLARTTGYAGRSVYDLFTADWEQFQSDLLEVAKQASAPIRHVSTFYENQIAQ